MYDFFSFQALLILAMHHSHGLMGVSDATPPQSIVSGCVVWPQIKVPEKFVEMWRSVQGKDSDRLDV